MSGISQSGILTAFGLALERKFREVPLTLEGGVGTNYVVGITGTNPHRFTIMEPGTGFNAAPDIYTGEDEDGGDIEALRTAKVGMSYNGAISMKADAENLYYPLLGLFGRDVQTEEQAAVEGGPIQLLKHVFTRNVYAPSFVAEEVFGDDTYARLTGGVVMQSLGLSFGRIVMANVSCAAFRQVPNVYRNSSNVKTEYLFGADEAVIPAQMSSLANGSKTWTRTADPVYCNPEQEQAVDPDGNGFFTFADVAFGTESGFSAAYMLIDGVAYDVQLLQDFTINIARRIDQSIIAGNEFDPGVPTGNRFSASGQMRIMFTDPTIQMTSLAHKKVSLNFRLIGCIPGAKGVKPYSLEVYIPNARFTASDGPTNTQGPITVGGNWVARRDPTLGYGIKVTLVNTVDNTTLAGAYPLELTMADDAAASQKTCEVDDLSYVVAGDRFTFADGTHTQTNAVVSFVAETKVITFADNFTYLYDKDNTTVTKVCEGGLGGWTPVAEA